MPSTLVAGFAGVAAAVCAAGVATLSVPLVTAGASLALLEYTVALWQLSRPPDVIAGVGIGLSLLLLLQVIDFARRVRGAALAPAVAGGESL
jgi:hypothetical protein